MFAVVPDPIPARMRVLNRAEVCDANFLDAVRGWRGTPRPRPAPDAPILPGSTLTAAAFGELFESQLASRQLDLMARVLRVQNKVFYTIGSSGHEGNALLARACRHTDPAFLHFRSGAFMAERSRQVPGIDPLRDAALSFAASADDPASGGRHKVWGSKPLWVLPQTSTIASHLPKALGTALAIESGKRLGQSLPIPTDRFQRSPCARNSSQSRSQFDSINSQGIIQGPDCPVPYRAMSTDKSFARKDSGAASAKTMSASSSARPASVVLDKIAIRDGSRATARTSPHCEPA